MKRSLVGRTTAVVAAGLLAASAPGLFVSTTASAATKTNFKNCTELQKTYRHGVGRSGARDKTSGKPVTTFKKSTSLYNAIIKNNRNLDRDRDGIACEKR